MAMASMILSFLQRKQSGKYGTANKSSLLFHLLSMYTVMWVHVALLLMRMPVSAVITGDQLSALDAMKNAGMITSYDAAVCCLTVSVQCLVDNLVCLVFMFPR